MLMSDLRETPRYTNELDFQRDYLNEWPDPPKIKVLFLSIYYPFFLGKYFERAMRRNPNIELRTTGPFTGSWIPWSDAAHPQGMNLPEKYANPPDVPLPFPPNVGRVSYDYVKAQLDGWIPDLIITADAGINWTSKPQDCFLATIGTDPHVLNYSHAREISDAFFCMQKCYMEQGDVYLPYAFDPTVHFKMESIFLPRPEADGSIDMSRPIEYDDFLREKDTDCVLIGMPYSQRVQWVDELRARGVSVIFENSPVFDEYRELANRARIGLNWSSMDDLNARFFETPAFGLAMVTNRVPDARLFLTEGIDYLGFDTLPEAITKVMHLVKNPDEVERLAQSAYQKIQQHTYDVRIQQLLEGCGF